MAYKAVFRIEPVKVKSLNFAISHITRNQEPDEHIDQSLIDSNIVLIGSADAAQVKSDLESESLLHKVSDKRAGVVYASGILTANKDFFDAEYKDWKSNPDLLKPWIDANLKFLDSGKVGIVKSAIVHLDEESPHIHFISVPVAMVTRGNRFGKKDVERLSYNALFSDTMQHVAECRKQGTTSTDTKLGRLQTEYADAVSRVGLVRGVTSRKKHITPKRFRQLLGNEANVVISDVELSAPSLFNYKKIHDFNSGKIDRFTNHVRQKANFSMDIIKSVRIQNDLLKSHNDGLEKTVMELQEANNAKAEIIKENKEYINAMRVLSKDAVIEAFGYDEESCKDYNFNRKFNAIDFVKHVEKCDFNQALVLLSEHFPDDELSIVAANDQFVEAVKSRIEKTKSKDYSNSDDELKRFKSDISLVDFAETNGFEIDNKRKSRSSFSVTMKGSAGKIVIARKDDHDVFFDVHDQNKSGSILDFCKHYLSLNLGHARKLLRKWSGSTDHVETKKTVLSQKPVESADKTSEFYSLYPCVHSEFLDKRCITVRNDDVRQNRKGGVCFPHYDDQGVICGWEVRARQFKGFEGSKGVGQVEAGFGAGVVISESMIDSLSYAQLHSSDVGLCMSTGGSASDDQIASIKSLLYLGKHTGPVYVATDADEAGNALAARIQAVLPDSIRVIPTSGKDWNDVLMQQQRVQVMGNEEANMSTLKNSDDNFAKNY